MRNRCRQITDGGQQLDGQHMDGQPYDRKTQSLCSLLRVDRHKYASNKYNLAHQQTQTEICRRLKLSQYLTQL